MLKSMTRQRAIIELLKDRGDRGASGLDFIRYGGGVDYRRRIHELRQDGYKIGDTWIKRSGSRFKQYFLENKLE